MAESNATQVILTDDGIKIIKAQNTADNAAGMVTNLNDPNLMSVIEKQNNIVQFAGLTSQFNVLVQNAKDEGIDTAAVTTAYNNLNTFMADILADPNHASDIDRARYKKYQDAYNEELAKLQNALQNNTNDKFTSAASTLSQAASTANVAKSAADSTYAYANSEIAVQSTAAAKAQSAADNAFNKAQEVGNQASSEIAAQSEVTAKAQSTADNAFSEAQSIGSQASSEIAVQSNATAKAQSTADSAFSQAVTAIDTGKATSQAVTALKDGSTLTIAQLGNGLASKVSNSEYASYKEQTASQIGQMVTNGAFSAYQQTTADLISAKVATKDFTAYQATTAKSIDSKVESSDFNTYKTQTANLIDEKVSNSEYASNKEQTASQIADRVSNSAFSTYQEQTASQFASKVDNGDFTTYKTQTADLISSKVATKDFSAYQDTTAKAISSKVESKDFNTYKTQTADLINDKVSNSAYASDKTQTASQISQMVSNSAFSAYQTQTASQIAQKVDNGAFSAYQQTTADLISSKVATKDFSAYQATTAKSIESKVESSDFNTYKTQTADAISSKVSSTDFNNLTISNRNLALGTATAIKATGSNQDNQLINGYRLSKTIPQGTVVTVTFDVSSTTGVGEFIMQFNGNDSGSSWQTVSTDNLIKGTKNVSATITTDTNHLGFSPKLNNATGDVTVSNFIISESSKEVNWSPAQEDMASQSQITQLSGQIDLSVKKGDLLSQINMQAGNTLISASKQLTLSSKSVFLDSDDPVIMKSANIDTLLVGKKLTAADISANTFTTNNGTFTVKQDGSVTAKSMTLIGGTLYTPTINASTINGSTINGTTFNAGDVIGNANNTAKYYPMTITPDGAYKSTYFDGAVGLQSSVESGAISYKYRSMIGSGQYLAYDSVINGQGFESQSGYTSAKDTTFSNPEKITGYVNVTPASGIYLYGPTQQINFAGKSDNIGSNGITMDAYGNIYAQSNSTWWRIGDVNGNQIVNFGTDKAGSNTIKFNRNTEIGNLFLGTGHTIQMLDGKPLYFSDTKGGRIDTYAGDVHYTSLVKSSLLSVKRDVQKADTAYWAQLVNSIDLATYQYKTDDNTSHIRLSSIVDDVNDAKQWQLPDVFISRDENGKLCGVDDSVLLNATLATVQEQQKEIDQLNGHNMELEAKLNSRNTELEARLNKLEARLNG